MNNGLLRGLGMHSLFPNISGNNPQYPAGNPAPSATVTPNTTPTVLPGNRPSDGNTIRKLASAEGGIIFSQDYIFIGNSISNLVFPKGVWDILILGGGAAGGGCAAGTNGTKSGGGGSASAFSFRGRFTFDGVGACDVVIGAGGTGVSASIGNSGGTTEVFLPNGVEWFVLGGSGGFACTNAVIGYGGIPGYPSVAGQGITAAPFAFVFYGSGGGLNTSSIFVSGIAGSCIEAGPVGGGAGAATNSSLGGNGGQQGIIDGGGNVGSGNTGTTTAAAGGNAAANSACGGGGSGGSFTAGAAQLGGNGGSGWVEAFRVG